MDYYREKNNEMRGNVPIYLYETVSFLIFDV